ncbi:hypothetical protein BsIDN1_17490 [Bacillus safensis]|uniref:SpoVR protein-like N-terminal domain-containing protein n=1 Tax=Bacillus safensis TaxID=561879 RepID=A0A5S9M5C0_BACIA|nr:hypothetical protein BsIDN1_17490 [Bacillus safensis]
MVESMSAAAERIKEYEHIHGTKEVEAFLDAVLAIQEHIDPSLVRSKLSWNMDDKESEDDKPKRQTPYDDLWGMDEPKMREKKKTVKQFPPKPEKDLLLFIEAHSRELEPWQRDVLTMLREEMLYFWPQLETKIMNEGWASYWHQRIMRELDLDSSESIEFAKLNAGVVQPSKTGINPYYLGLKIFEDIEERYNNPCEELKKQGSKKDLAAVKCLKSGKLNRIFFLFETT